MKILFAGTPEIAVPSLQALVAQYDVALVLTNPDKPQGRHHTLMPSAVKTAALELGLDVLQPERLRGDVLQEIASYKCDVLVCFAYGKIFGPKLLSLFPKGCFNIHPSLLPLYRGPAPIQYAILHGDAKTGISVQQLSLGVDEGNIVSVQTLPLDGTETSESLTQKVAAKAAPQIVEVIESIEKGHVSFHPQEGEVVLTSMLEKDQSRLDWNLSAATLHAKIRSFYPWPKTDTTFDGKKLTISGVAAPLEEEKCDGVVPGTVLKKDKKRGIGIACGDGIIYINRLQLAGKKEMDFKSFLNGNPSFIGSILE